MSVVDPQPWQETGHPHNKEKRRQIEPSRRLQICTDQGGSRSLLTSIGVELEVLTVACGYP